MQERKDLSRTESEKEERNGSRGRKPLHVSREVQKEKGEKQLKRRKKERYDYSYQVVKKKEIARSSHYSIALYRFGGGKGGKVLTVLCVQDVCVVRHAIGRFRVRKPGAGAR